MVSLIEHRRALMQSALPVGRIYAISASGNLTPSSTPTLSNSYGTTIGSTSYNGEIVVTQASAGLPSSQTNYRNGYANIGVDGLETGKKYKLIADVAITNELIDGRKLAFGVNGAVYENTDYVILNGNRLDFEFTYTANGSRKYIELRVGGMSLIIRNVKIYEAV